MNTGIDGGMNKIFAAHVPGGATGLSDEGTSSVALASAKLPGTIPSHVNPPRALEPEQPPVVAEAPAPATRMAIAAPESSSQSSSSGNFFSSLARKVGLGGSDNTAPTAPVARPPAPTKPKVETAKRHDPRAARTASRAPAPKHVAPKASAKTTAKSDATRKQANAISGAQPAVPSNGFDSRFSAMR
jgi:hypothetical protein